MRAWLVFAVVVATALAANADGGTKIVCYLGTWAVYRPDNGKYNIEDIDPLLCTHFVYAFVGLSTEGKVKVLDSWNDMPDGKDGFRRFTGLKEKNPNARWMIGIGGWNEGSLTYSDVMNNPTLRGVFVDDSIRFMKEFGFNGFDLDWEYPGQRGGKPYDKENYVKLLEEMRPKFDQEGFELSAAVAAGVEGVDISYDVPSLSKYLDHINVMTYDLHGPWEQVTGQNAPLYASSKDVSELQKTLNVKAAIEHWLKRGADKSKIVMGMATYGHVFTLSSSNIEVGAPTTGPGQAGPYTRQPGMLGYNEICESQMKGGWDETWDDEQKVPIGVKDRQWAGYDNIKSITLKVEFAKSMGLAGGMIWSLETDDFKNVCGGGRYPLLTTINEVFNGYIPTTGPTEPTTTDPDATTTTTEPTTTTTPKPPPPHDICQGEGYVRDKDDCSKFYYCQLNNGAYTVFEYQCSPPLLFDNVLDICNYPDLVEC